MRDIIIQNRRRRRHIRDAPVSRGVGRFNNITGGAVVVVALLEEGAPRVLRRVRVRVLVVVVAAGAVLVVVTGARRGVLVVLVVVLVACGRRPVSEAGFGRRTIGEGKVDAAPRPPPKCGFFASTSSSGTLNAAAGARHARATRSSSSASPIKGFTERAAMTTGAALRDASNAGARVSNAFFRPGATCAASSRLL